MYMLEVDRENIQINFETWREKEDKFGGQSSAGEKRQKIEQKKTFIFHDKNAFQPTGIFHSVCA